MCRRHFLVHVNCAVVMIGDDQIEASIAVHVVQVFGDHADRAVAGGNIRLRLKRSVSIAEQNRNRVRGFIGDCEIHVLIVRRRI